MKIWFSRRVIVPLFSPNGDDGIFQLNQRKSTFAEGEYFLINAKDLNFTNSVLRWGGNVRVVLVCNNKLVMIEISCG